MEVAVLPNELLVVLLNLSTLRVPSCVEVEQSVSRLVFIEVFDNVLHAFRNDVAESGRVNCAHTCLFKTQRSTFEQHLYYYN